MTPTADIKSLADQIKSKADEIDALSTAPPVTGSPPAIFTSPKPNQVFQKTGATAVIKVTWRGNADLVRIKQGATVIAESATGDFTLNAGWYDFVLVTAGEEGDTIKSGVGDVYLVAGQSNGVSPRFPETYTPVTPTAGKVIVSDYYKQGFHSFRDCGVQPLTEYPVAGVSWLYCGLALNRAYPIMFVIVAQGSTSSAQWSSTYFSRITEATAIYRPRAILWHQGESDAVAAMTQAQSFANLDGMVYSLRNVNVIPWVVCKTSYWPVYTPILSAEQQLIDKWAHVYQGPNIDDIRDHAEQHVIGANMQVHGERWASSLTAIGL